MARCSVDWIFTKLELGGVLLRIAAATIGRHGLVAIARLLGRSKCDYQIVAA